MTKGFLKLLLPLAVILLLAAFCAGARAAELTLMVYLSGGNLESERGAATTDIREMMDALPEDGSLNVILLASGAKAWEIGVDPESSNIYRLRKDSLETLDEAPLASMGSADSLSRLLNYAPAAFPAERYALILWDHGAGPMGGLCFDELYAEGESFDRLTLDELRAALENSPFGEEKLAWIGLDACLMASVETAAILAPYADYLIASEETEPAMGWDYAFLKEAAGDADGAETGRRVAEAYARAYEGALNDITLSVVDLSRLPAFLESFSALARSLNVTRENYSAYATARLNLRQMGGIDSDYFDLVDLRALLLSWREIGDADCGEALALLEEAVPFHYENARGCGGLSVYYPYANKARYTTPWSLETHRLAVAAGYVEYLDKACAYWLGEPLADWSRPFTAEVEADEAQRISVLLTPEQCEQFASARLLVVKESLPGKYEPVYQSDDVTLFPGGLLRASYASEAMFLVDKDGVPVTNSLLYREKNGMLCTIAGLIYPDEESTLGERWEVAWLVYKKNEAGEYEFVYAKKDMPEELGGKEDFQLDECKELWIVSTPRVPVWDENGRLLPWKQWDTTDVLHYTVLDEVDPLRPVVQSQQDGYQRFAFIEVTDLQGNVYCSDLTPLTEKYRIELMRNVPVEENEFVTITLAEASAVCGVSPYLYLYFEVTNNRDVAVNSSCNLQFDEGVKPNDEAGYYGWGFVRLDPGETGVWEYRFPASFFENNGIAEMDELTLSVLSYAADELTDRLKTTVVVPLHFDPSILGGD